MQKKTKIIAGVSTLVVTGLIVGLSFQGNLDQLQGRFNKTFQNNSEAMVNPTINQVDSGDLMTTQDYYDALGEILESAEEAHDIAENAYLVASIPGLEEEGPEDFANYSDIVTEQHFAIIELNFDATDVYEDYLAREPDSSKTVQHGYWKNHKDELAAIYRNISVIKTDITEWLTELRT